MISAAFSMSERPSQVKRCPRVGADLVEREDRTARAASAVVAAEPAGRLEELGALRHQA
ncbi:MAG: hypothetical protein OEV36_01965 [Myxococcales bacterium]|nr:hypothetical protein [Myxococcales bacterium]